MFVDDGGEFHYFSEGGKNPMACRKIREDIANIKQSGRSRGGIRVF
jgi:hypothetical protein